MRSLTAAFLGTCMFAIPSVGIDYVFPPEAKVFDVTKAPYNADNTGKTDVSAILSKAANDIINITGWNPGIMYLPNGTYLVKNTITWRINANGNGCGPHMIGQSRAGTVIKLAKGTWPLGTEGKGVIQTGAGTENNFNKGIMNLTVLVDSNNAGAIGIIYVSDNTGMMSDVNVISADGKGMYGINSAGLFAGSTVAGNGPFIIRRTRIKGFSVGFRGCASEGEMMSQITLEGQTKYGIWVSCGNLTLDSLTSYDTVQAIEAQAPVLVTHAYCPNGVPTRYAIRNFILGSYFSDIKTSGFKGAITTAGPIPAPLVPSFDEFTAVAPVSLFPSPKHSINLPARYPPEIPWETDFTKWAFPADYKTGGRTDAQALQAAIDDPAKTTVCLPWGTILQIDQPVYIRGTIKRIFGTGGGLHKASANARVIFDNGTAPIVKIEKVSIDNVVADGSNDIPLVKQSGRTMVLETFAGPQPSITGPGETYLTDACATRYLIDNPRARVYMWQWEGNCCMDTTLTVKNGMVRAVGYYDEGNGSMLFCLGGITEILGYWEYSTSCMRSSTEFLMTVTGNANASAAGVWQQNFCNPWGGYDQLVSETRNGATKILYGSSGTGRTASPAGGNIALYTAYDSAQVAQTMVTGISPVKSIDKVTARPFAVQNRNGIELRYQTISAGPVTIIASDIAGRIVAIHKKYHSTAGSYSTTIAGLSGFGCIQLHSPGGDVTSIAVCAISPDAGNLQLRFREGR